MRSIFLNFPEGAAGAGLFLLRLSNMVSLLASASINLDGARSWIGVLLATGLVIGIRTRLAALLCAALALSDLTNAEPVATLSQLTALIALMLTGPGAYSADARLFGRRTISLAAGR
ncbi:MAG TPA: hypothetical protein VFG14_12510 [Chthoniobacteraceae bacterium]|nr:hypothetical protein [Chthoniobacteraceae bacterium]